jgi:DNA-binding CsgD family transcriptional regulator/5-methylcytosine-specific restriction endonuclease McrA
MLNKNLLKQLYIIEGKSSTEISKLLNITIYQIFKYLKKFGFKVRHSGSKGNEVKITKEKLYQLYVKELKSSPDIAKIFNVSSVTVRNYLIEYGFKKYLVGYRPNFKIRGNNHPTKRPEVQQKMRDNHYDCKGENNPNFGQGYKIEGNKNPNWLGGISNNGYSWEFNDSLKEIIRTRDNHICQNCGMTEEEHFIEYNELLHIHHIDYDKMNCTKSNLITLCLRCNIKANYNRDEWRYKFEGVLNGK